VIAGIPIYRIALDFKRQSILEEAVSKRWLYTAAICTCTKYAKVVWHGRSTGSNDKQILQPKREARGRPDGSTQTTREPENCFSRAQASTYQDPGSPARMDRIRQRGTSIKTFCRMNAYLRASTSCTITRESSIDGFGGKPSIRFLAFS
jgi:hypothetical protein